MIFYMIVKNQDLYHKNVIKNNKISKNVNLLIKIAHLYKLNKYVI